MPGRRLLRREITRHAATSPERVRALYAQLLAVLPDRERAIVGQSAILAHLAGLGLRRLNGRPLSWRIVRRWHVTQDFPMLPGRIALGFHHAAPVTTVHAVTAWLVTRRANCARPLFSIPWVDCAMPAMPERESAPSKFPARAA